MLKQMGMTGVALAALVAISHAAPLKQDSVRSELAVRKTLDTLVDPQALVLGETRYGLMRFGSSINGNAFQQDAVVTHKKYQYVGYYDAQRHVCIARRNVPDGAWKILRFEDYTFKVNDAHNTISLGICPNDGTIHIAFDHHARGLNYRVSKKGVATHPESVGWETALFGETQSRLGEFEVPSITYPRFWPTPDGELQLCWRRNGSGDGDRMLADYDSEAGTWKTIHPIDSREGLYGDSDSRCSYPNGYTYGPKGRLHATWVWRESATKKSNHDLMYAYSEDLGLSWKNGEGRSLDTVPRVDSPGITAVEISDGLGLMNTHGQAVDSRGRIHIVMWHSTKESLAAAGSEPGAERWGVPRARRYHHYWRDDSGVWNHRQLPGVAGNRPKLLLDAEDNAYLIFGRPSAEEEMEKGVYFKRGDLVIMASSSESKWMDWKVVHLEKGPFYNEMLYDTRRFKESGILSVMVQETPELHPYSSALRILDFELNQPF